MLSSNGLRVAARRRTLTSAPSVACWRSISSHKPHSTEELPASSTTSPLPTPHSSPTPSTPSAPSTPTSDKTMSQSVAASKKSHAERDAEAFKRFEERFGGAEASALGELVDGKPEGLKRSVKNNLFRLI